MLDNKIVIFDLDGTLANTDARMRLATANKTREADYTKIDWDILHDPDNIRLDIPNEPVVTMCHVLYDKGASIYIFSGRSDRTKLATKIWLDEHKIPYHKLVMRPSSKKEKYLPDEVLWRQKEAFSDATIYSFLDGPSFTPITNGRIPRGSLKASNPKPVIKATTA